jgi:glycine cleavage system pyridoxal-binding protein P
LKTRVGTPLTKQAEIAGKIRSHFEFQTMVIELEWKLLMHPYSTKLLREAMALCLMFAQRSKKSNVNKFFVSEEILPQLYPFYKLVLHQIRVSYWKPPRV